MRLLPLGLCLAAALSLGCHAAPPPARPATATEAVMSAGPRALFPGPEMDYQPGVLRARDGRLFLVAERLTAPGLSGDLLLSVSPDGGATWPAPVPIVATAASERHPAPVQHPDGSFSLFYMAGTPAAGYRIHRATSPDGRAWTPCGALELGWETPGEVNPAVLVERGGALTMTYHRLRGAAYIARSTDGGATWDRRRTTVSDSLPAALPRITRREADGTYLLTYQRSREGTRLDLLAKTSRDPYDWSAAPVPVSAGGNSHDSRPAVLADGTFFVPFVDTRGDTPFNVFYRTTRDGREWTLPVRVTEDTTRMDVEPFPIPLAGSRRVLLFWGRQAGPDAPRDYDLWLHPALAIP
jgi:hypothetical protein